MICKNCGEKLKDDAKYCSKCGRNVETSKIHKNKILLKYYLIGLVVGLILIGVLAIFPPPIKPIFIKNQSPLQKEVIPKNKF